jgi:acyl-CoA thioesterase-2
VDRSRDGGSFTTRRVVAVQNGKQIFNLAASFQAPEEGFEHQAAMPSVARPDDLPSEAEALKAALEKMPEEARKWATRPRPIEMRPVDGSSLFDRDRPEAREPKSEVWFRARAPIGEDPVLHQVILSYASDMNLLSTAMRPHRVHWQTRNFQSASLDHAMWFHKPMNFNDWHLYAQDSPSAAGGRGFIRGSIYSREGVLVASVAQEGLLRMRKD